MRQLDNKTRSQILACFVEGNSLRATVRMTGAAKKTVSKLLVDLGKACEAYQDKAFVNLKSRRIECDEIWSFVYAKEKNCPSDAKKKGGGDAWTWVALDPDSKLVPCWMVGKRDASYACHFIHDLKKRLVGRVQLTTDGYQAYIGAVEDAFGSEVDYGMLVKIYGTPQDGEGRYSPAQCIGIKKTVICGNPNMENVSTSLIERQNLTMRMGMRRFTRLTNAFSKKIENHEHALAIHYMYYNFCRIHQSLRVTPAMEAGISDHVWSLEEVVSLLD